MRYIFFEGAHLRLSLSNLSYLLSLFPCTYCAYKRTHPPLTYYHFDTEYLPNIIISTMNSYLVLIVNALLGSSLATPVAAPDPTQTIAEIVAGTPIFSTLLAALQAADLVDTLSGPGPFTVFAPDNVAFSKIPDADLEALLADVPALTAVLLRHVVPANIPVRTKHLMHYSHKMLEERYFIYEKHISVLLWRVWKT
jgi:uncharacterized surface protein with fasciclin (FAS1) repeats